MHSSDHNRSRFATALSLSADTPRAAREVSEAAMSKLDAGVDLAIAFASADHQDEFAGLAETLADELSPTCLLGCTGESIVCDAREIEGESALALWVAHLPEVTLLPMQLSLERAPEGGAIVGWPEADGETWPQDASLLLLADPYSFPTDQLLNYLNESYPGMPVYGGMASGGNGPNENRLLFGRTEVAGGAVGVLVHGGIKMRGVVSQGCRPIGRPFVVTKADQNVILELGGRPAMAQAQEVFQTLSPDEQQMVRQGLHVGQVINEYQDHFGRGDFLIRNVQGADPQSGAIAIGDLVRVGQTVQFHLRDAQTADEELHALVASAKESATGQCLGGLMFTCNGRGKRLFGEPNHDAAVVSEYWKGLPVAGFFAQGEIGPIGKRSFLHGFTASIVLFEALAKTN